ncbi:Uncharacterized protein DBV15_01823 [Temnothorax longispinosus]|uniref:Uncharacterized protein n=1 Tax=Temnothorax longispinosus TaxID=300112 RepID=A0A4S2KVC3_9HYME|nr:Uncharacterized protein DBV15_01823 [Temnothorax longispinosus]
MSKKSVPCGFSGPQPRETGYCRLSKPRLITCFANAALGIALMLDSVLPKYWINKLPRHQKKIRFSKLISRITQVSRGRKKSFADNDYNEVHASWFQSTARASREMSVNAARRRQGRIVGIGRAPASNGLINILPLQPRVTDIIMLITSATLSNRLHVKQRTRSERGPRSRHLWYHCSIEPLEANRRP